LRQGFSQFSFQSDDFETWMRRPSNGESISMIRKCVRLLWERNPILCEGIDAWGASLGHTIFEKDRDGILLSDAAEVTTKTFHSLVNALPMMETLAAKCQERGVQAISRMMITHLIREDDGAILGRLVSILGWAEHAFSKTKAGHTRCFRRNIPLPS